MTIYVRKADIIDLHTIIKLENEIFNMGYSNDFIEFILSEGNNYIAFIDNNPVGYLLSNYDDYMFDTSEMIEYMDKHNDRILFTIISFGILEKYRGKRIGSTLMKFFLEDINNDKNIEKVVLQVKISNNYAIHLYEKFGFVIDSVLKDYYTNPTEDAYLMVKYML